MDLSRLEISEFQNNFKAMKLWMNSVELQLTLHQKSLEEKDTLGMVLIAGVLEFVSMRCFLEQFHLKQITCKSYTHKFLRPSIL